MKKRKIEQMSQKIDIIIAGKRKKLLSKGITGTIYPVLNKTSFNEINFALLLLSD